MSFLFDVGPLMVERNASVDCQDLSRRTLGAELNNEVTCTSQGLTLAFLERVIPSRDTPERMLRLARAKPEDLGYSLVETCKEKEVSPVSGQEN